MLLVVGGWLGLLDRPPTSPRRWHLGADQLTARIGLAIAGAALAGWWTRWVVAAVAVGLLGWLAPSFVGLRAQRRRTLARSEAIAIWAEMLRDLLVTNAGLHEAIGKSARVAPAAIREEVRALYVRAQRGDLSAALARFADDMDDAIADTVVTALQIADQRAVSDLGQMLAAVATSTRETVAMQLRVNAARARTYRTAQLIAGIVAFFVGLLVLSNRSYMEPFGTLTGQLVLAGVCGIVGRFGVGDGRAVAPGAAPSGCCASRTCRRRVGWGSVRDLGRRARRAARRRRVADRPGAGAVAPIRCGRSPTSSSRPAPWVPGAASPVPACGAGGGRSRRGSAPAPRPGCRPTSRCCAVTRPATCSTSSATPCCSSPWRRCRRSCSRCSTSACRC